MFHTPASLLYRLKTPAEVVAWERFIELYTPLLFHWASQLGYQESDGADLVQDVFIILWRKLPEFEYDPSKSFHAWLKTLFMNRFRTLQRNRDLRHLPLVDHEPLENMQDAGMDAEESRYLIRQVFRLIERDFPLLHQQVFRAYVLQERPAEEVALLYEVGIGTVYGIKSKVLSRLRLEMRNWIDGVSN
jgi:RNA polymerase sigma-70 factor (ECF subfamily)